MNKKQNGNTVKYSRVYGIYNSMINRCYNPKNDSYMYYGEKGITVCQEWLDSFQEFLKWSFKNGYGEKLSIDRIDNSKPYDPNNCRWIDLRKQSANRGMFKNNTTGITGVSRRKNAKKGFRAEIMRNGKRKHLGVFETLEEAATAYEKARNEAS